MYSPTEFLLYAAAGFMWWLAVYLISRNTRSRLAWIVGLFVASLAVYVIGDATSRKIEDYFINVVIWKSVGWSYLLPLGLLFHFSVLVTKREALPINRFLVVAFYAISLFYMFCSAATNWLVRYDLPATYFPDIGYANPRGPLFSSIAVTVFAISIFSLWNYLAALKNTAEKRERMKFRLSAITSLLYLVVGPLLVYLYQLPDSYQSAIISYTPLLLILPLLPAVIAVLFFRLVSEVDPIFNVKEFIYLSGALAIINVFNGGLFVTFAPQLGEAAYYWMAIYLFITILTHGFYDWLTTFVRDLLYNAGRGFSIITDAEVADLVRSFHEPEKLETNTLLKFNAVKKRADGDRLVDAAQQLAREAIEYFKQPDFPRRSKQNLKYQLLKMVMLDDADEGQILWELGFDGYPMKIMSGEDNTRRPLFKVESMSDYTATSRNAFIALKKEAIHDLAWRLSYLEKITK